MLNNRLFIIIAVIVLLILALGAGLFFVFNNNEYTPSIAEQPSVTNITSVTYPFDDEIIIVKPFEGNASLSDARKSLLETNILDEIVLYKKGSPKCDEFGNVLTDEHGVVIYESNALVDYDEVETNLAIIINYFADKNYSSEAIHQLQRYYFNYARAFAKYNTENVLERLELCFPSNGTTPNELTKKAEEVFGQIREDGFQFVFETPVPVKEQEIAFFAVKAWGNTTLTIERERFCIFELWYSGNEYERNLEGWLHKIINEMSDFGYGEKEIIIAQLLFSGSLIDTEYRCDLMEAIYQCIPVEIEHSFEELKLMVQNKFDVDIEENIALMDYLEGKTSYKKGVIS